MDENSGTGKKLRADAVVSVVPAPAAAKQRSIGAEKTKKKTAKADQMKVLEGGARKRPPDVKDHIGRQLKAIYDDVLQQPVPSRFTDLLHELATKSKTGGT